MVDIVSARVSQEGDKCPVYMYLNAKFTRQGNSTNVDRQMNT